MPAAEKSLKKSEEAELEKIAETIDNTKLGFVTGIMAIGRALTEAQELLSTAGRKGQFLAWVEDRCQFSKSTAYNYISAFSAFHNCPKFGHFDQSALFLLAKNDAARTKAIALATKGYLISHEKAKELVEEAKQATSSADQKADPPASDPATTQENGHETSADPTIHTDVNEDSEPPECPNCQSTERDADGDCAKCKDPCHEEKAAQPAKDAPEAGGYEPEEAKKHLDAIKKALGVAARAHGDVQTMLGKSDGLSVVFTHIEAASLSLHAFRESLKRGKR
jgi:Protein of unknown function (DUF3102)